MTVTVTKQAMAVLWPEVWFLEGKWECTISSNKFRSSVRWQLPKEPFPSDSVGVIWGLSYQIQLDNIQTVCNWCRTNFELSVVKPILNVSRFIWNLLTFCFLPELHLNIDNYCFDISHEFWIHMRQLSDRQLSLCEAWGALDQCVSVLSFVVLCWSPNPNTVVS